MKTDKILLRILIRSLKEILIKQTLKIKAYKIKPNNKKKTLFHNAHCIFILLSFAVNICLNGKQIPFKIYIYIMYIRWMIIK